MKQRADLIHKWKVSFAIIETILKPADRVTVRNSDLYEFRLELEILENLGLKLHFYKLKQAKINSYAQQLQGKIATVPKVILVTIE